MSARAGRPIRPRDFQRYPPYGRLTPRQRLVMRADQIRPVIRIAHRQRGPIRIADRLIVDHELVLIRRGAGSASIGDSTFRFDEGALLLIPPFVPHGIMQDLVDSAEHIAVHFDLSPSVPRASTRLRERQPYDVSIAHCDPFPSRRLVPVGSGIDRALLRIIDLRDADDPVSRAEASAELTLVLLHLLRDARLGDADASPDGDWQQQRMQRVAEWIDSHYVEALQVGDLALLAGLSPSHFSRIFRKWAGYSPMEYLKRARIEQARRLLAASDLSVKEIAAAVGFPDPYHFSRVFRQIDGLTATQYRDAAHATGKTHESDSE